MVRNLKNIMRLIDDAKNELPVEKNFLFDLKRSIELDDSENTRKPSSTYKPSSMNCIRNMYYQVTGAEPAPSTSSYMLVGICNSGTDIHERIQTAVSKMKLHGIDCEYVDVAEFVNSRGIDGLTVVSKQGMETKLFYKPLNISFLCDGIIRYKGKYYILELKTETSYKWQQREFVDRKHFNQAIAYSTILGLNNVLFIYISRDNLDMKSYMFVVTNEMKMELVNKIEKCDSYVKKLSIPPKPEEANGKFCQYCSYRLRCDTE